MNLVKLIGVLCLFMICACKEEKFDYGIPLNTISFDFEKDKGDFSDLLNLIDSIQVVKLETNENCLISQIAKIVYDKNHIYILDAGMPSAGLLKYTLSGKFVQKIANKGKGPGEYIRLDDFLLVNGQFVLLDTVTGKIMFFSKAGDFINEFSINQAAEKFGQVDTNLFAIFKGNRPSTLSLSHHKISIIDNKGNTVKNLMKMPSYLRGKSLELYKPTASFGKELLYIDPFSNDIFCVNKDSLAIKYRFDFGKHSFDNYNYFLKSNKQLSTGQLLTAINKKDVVNNLDNFNETEKYLSFYCLKKGKQFLLYYNKEEKKSYIFQPLIVPHIYSDYNSFVSSVPSSVFEDMKQDNLKELSKDRLFSKFVPIIEQTEASDNPILVTYYFN